MSRRLDEGKHKRWQRLLREQKASGASVVAFCARRRIPVHQFYWWQRRLRTVSVSDHQEAKKDATFVPVRLNLTAAPIEIVHRHGHVIRVHDAASLRQVLLMLEGDSPPTEV